MQTKFVYKNLQIVEAFRLPNLDEDVPEEFHAWAEKVGLSYESGRDGTLIVTGQPSEFVVEPGEWLLKLKHGIYKADDQAFNRVFKAAPDTDALEKFLDAAAGEGLILAGVDAADLYVSLFPEQYRARLKDAN